MLEFPDASSIMDSQTIRAEQDPSLLIDRQWIVETAETLARINELVVAIRNLNAPASLQHIHNQALELATTLESYIALYISGVDGGSRESILKAEIELTAAWGWGAFILLDIESFCDASG